MNKVNFIKVSDAETIEKMKSEGFQIIEETNGVVTFLNDTSKKVDFDDKKVVYTNKLNI
jgi:hypothetical protein